MKSPVYCGVRHMTKREKLAPKDFIGKREWQHDDSKVSENMNGNKIAGVSNNQTY